jgi:hypothetical protein
MRADLLALTPASIASLANMGLVKRAQREIAAGTGPTLEEDDGGLVTGTFADGVVAKLPPQTPLRDARCTCGALGVCRHRVAVALAYPAWHASHAKTQVAPPSKREAWSPGVIDDDALAEVLGKRVMERARAAARSGIVVEVHAMVAALADSVPSAGSRRAACASSCRAICRTRAATAPSRRRASTSRSRCGPSAKRTRARPSRGTMARRDRCAR